MAKNIGIDIKIIHLMLSVVITVIYQFLFLFLYFVHFPIFLCINVIILHPMPKFKK